MTFFRALVLGLALAVLLVTPSCTKPPQALAVELLYDEVPVLQEEGYSYVRAESLVAGFVVLVQQSEMPSTAESTPVFWVGEGRAHAVNTKAQSLAPDLAVAPQMVFDMLDPALFPETFRGAFSEMLKEPEGLEAPAVSIDSAERVPESL